MTELDKLLRDLSQPGVPTEIAVLAGCLLLAFGLCWVIGRKQPPDSVWFGRGVVDGLLFPLVALALTYSAQHVLVRLQPVAILKIAVAVLIALAGIRFLARVFTVVFPSSALARLVERLLRDETRLEEIVLPRQLAARKIRTCARGPQIRR